MRNAVAPHGEPPTRQHPCGTFRGKMLEVGVLGPLVLALDGVTVSLNRARERALLSILVVESGRTVSSDRMIEALWGDQLPSRPLAALQTAVSRVRRSIGALVIVTGSGGYAFDPSAASVDAERFERLVHSAHRAEPDRALGLLDEALALWRGTPYSEFEYEDFVTPEVTRLQELRLSALEQRAKSLLNLGRHEEMIPELSALVARHPMREPLWAHLMVALYRSGRQTDALAAYRSIRKNLIEGVGLEPGPLLRRTEERILTQDPTLEAGHTPTPSRVESSVSQRLWVPNAMTSMIGRDREASLVKEQLAHSRLVTVTGPAGVGKTRLVLEVAHDVIDDYEDGAAFVGIDALDDSWTVGDIARYAVDGLPDSVPLADWVADILHGRSLLLVLDGCERLTDELAPILARLLERCRGVAILASSRRRFGIGGEAVVSLQPLPLPQPGELHSPATDLFIQRAPSMNPERPPDPETMNVVGRIASALDGLPLAIELAASRSGYLPLADLADQLEDRTDLLTSRDPTAQPKRRGLSAAIATSWDLLEPGHQQLLLAVSVLRTPWGFDDAARMLDPPGTIEVVERMVLDLVDRSLLLPGRSTTPESRTSFTMLRPIRDFIAAQGGDGRAPTLRWRHAEIFQSIAAQFGARHEWGGEWGSTVEVEERLSDIEDALSWLAEHDKPAGLRMACNLGMLWTFGERRSEGERHLRTLLPEANVDSRWVALGLFLLGSMIRPGGFSLLESVGLTTFEDRWRDRRRLGADGAARTRESADLLTEALAMWARLDIEPHRYARVELARSLATAGDYAGAERVLGTHHQGGDQDVACFAELVLARIALARGDLDAALGHAGHVACRDTGTLQVFRADTAARLALARLDWAGAAQSLGELLVRHSDAGNLPAAAVIHLHLSVLSATRGNSDAVRHHAGRALELGRRFGISRIEPLVRLAQGWAHFVDRDYEMSLEYTAHSVALSERLGDTYGVGIAKVGSGIVLNHAGNPQEAVRHFRHALGLTTGQPGSAQTYAASLFHLANSYHLLGRSLDAGRLLGAESEARAAVRTFLAPGWAEGIDPYHTLEEELGPDRFTALLEEGRLMQREDVMALALSE